MARCVYVEVRIHLVWWLRWYLVGVAITTRITGLEPDVGRMTGWLRRGLRWSVSEVRSGIRSASIRGGGG